MLIRDNLWYNRPDFFKDCIILDENGNLHYISDVELSLAGKEILIINGIEKIKLNTKYNSIFIAEGESFSNFIESVINYFIIKKDELICQIREHKDRIVFNKINLKKILEKYNIDSKIESDDFGYKQNDDVYIIDSNLEVIKCKYVENNWFLKFNMISWENNGNLSSSCIHQCGHNEKGCIQNYYNYLINELETSTNYYKDLNIIYRNTVRYIKLLKEWKIQKK